MYSEPRNPEAPTDNQELNDAIAAAERQTYTVKQFCLNCRRSYNLTLPKGYPVPVRPTCPHCGC